MDANETSRSEIDPLSDAKIIDSWEHNAAPWTSAIRGNRIESRSLVTNQAIIDAVMSRSPGSVLDIGCGEGWLIRALAEFGVAGIGVDAVPALIEQAARDESGDFRVASYEEIARGSLQVSVDVAVANFSLIGKESVENLVAKVPGLLAKRGSFIVQTLHPVTANGDLEYEDGWRKGSWTGFSSDFSDPAPWYFRTMNSWIEMLKKTGCRTLEVREPVNPATKKPASVVFIADFA